MKINKINNLIRKAKNPIVYNEVDGDGEIKCQYIACDGAACFRLHNLPIFDDKTIRGFLELDDSKDFTYEIIRDMPLTIKNCLRYNDDTDIYLEVSEEIFGMRALKGEGVFQFVDAKLIKPFLNDDTIMFNSRQVPGISERVIVIHEGFFVIGFIMPIIPKERIEQKIEFVSDVYSELKKYITASQD